MLKIIYFDYNNIIIKNYDIFIYYNKNLVFRGKTEDGYIHFSPPCYGAYNICIKTDNSYIPHIFYTCFYYHKNTDKILPIFLNNFRNNNSPLITISLIDINYNMPIERGNVILWQKNIQ